MPEEERIVGGHPHRAPFFLPHDASMRKHLRQGLWPGHECTCWSRSVIDRLFHGRWVVVGGGIVEEGCSGVRAEVQRGILVRLSDRSTCIMTER